MILPGDYAKGFDVSMFSGKFLDFSRLVADGFQFVIARSSLNDTVVDPLFSSHIAKATAQGLILGSYHAFFANGDPESQARFYHQVAEGEGLLAGPSLPPVNDFELLHEMDSKEATKRALAFTIAIEELWGTKSLFYSYPWFIKSLDACPEKTALADHDLWIAEYNVSTIKVPLPWTDWKIGQYKGDVTTYGGDVDFDVFHGSLDDLKLYCTRKEG